MGRVTYIDTSVNAHTHKKTERNASGTSLAFLSVFLCIHHFLILRKKSLPMMRQRPGQSRSASCSSAGCGAW